MRLLSTLLILFMFGSMVAAQDKTVEDPCKSEIFLKGQENGWYRLPPKQIPVYFKTKFQCWKLSRNKKPSLKTQIAMGGAGLNSTRPMNGWTSTHAVFTTIAVSIYFINRSVK